MGILFKSERRLSPTFPEPPIAPYPGANLYGSPSYGTNPSAAMAIPTVWACVGLLANAVSMLPLETYRKSAGIPSRITDPLLVTSPSAGMTQAEWLHMLMVSLLIRGNAYGMISSRDPKTARPTQIDLLNPDTVRVDQDARTGVLSYRVGTSQTPVDANDIWHMRGLTLPGQKIGLSPIAYAATVLGLDVSSRRFAGDFFNGGGVPKSVLASDQRIDRTQGEALLERFKGKFASNSREPIILGAGMKYTQISVSPEESQFLATQAAGVSQIARYFWVKPEMVGGTSGNPLAYSTPELNGSDFLTYSVAHWLKRIEDAWFPLLPQPQYVKFKTDALMRTDATTQATVDIQLIAGKIATRDEIRTRRDMPPLTAEQLATLNDVPELTITPKGGAKALPLPPAPAPEPVPEGAPSG